MPKTKRPFRAKVTGTTSLPKVLPGLYRVTAATVEFRGGTATPRMVTQTVIVAPSRTARVTVNYLVTPWWDAVPSATPMRARMSVDPTRVLTRTVGTQGGQFSITDGRGVRFLLKIPAGAIASPVKMTMQTLLGSTRLPLGTFTAGVRIFPENLRVGAGVTLQMLPPKTLKWALAQQVAVAVDSASAAVSVVPINAESSAVVLPLTKFRTFALVLGRAGWDGVLNFRSRIGADADARLESAIAERLGRERLKNVGKLAQPWLPSVVAATNATYTDVISRLVRPTVLAPSSDCSVARETVGRVVNVDSLGRLIGKASGSGLSTFYPDLQQKVLDGCIEPEFQACVTAHKVTRIGPLFTELSALARQLGREPDEGQAAERVRSCLQFDVQIDGISRALLSDPAGEVSEKVSARVRLQPSQPESAGTVESLETAVVSTEYTARYVDTCAVVSGLSKTGATVKVTGFTPTVRGDSWAGLSLSLALTPPARDSQHTVSWPVTGTCTQSRPAQTIALGWWPSFGKTWNLTAPLSSWTLNPTSDILATTTIPFSRSDAGSSTSGSVDVRVVHVPLS